MHDHPVVVIGAGPQGLAAAAHLLDRDLPVVVLEAGPAAGAAVSEWDHVRLFSEWDELVDAAARRLLESTGWTAPASGYPTGAEWVAHYLTPLAAALGEAVQVGARVTGVERVAGDFAVSVMRPGGSTDRVFARAVLDASGTWNAPQPAGADGALAAGELEAAAAGLVVYRIPTLAQAIADAGRHVVVVGNGHSAATAVLAAADVARGRPGTRVTWVLRRGDVGTTFGGGENDELPARGALGSRARRAVDDGTVRLVTGFRTTRIDRAGGRAVLVAEDGRTLDPADRVVVLTGFRPDLGMLESLRLELDPRIEAPVRLAAEIDPEIHSCGTVRATGVAELAHPEPSFFLVGAKSYGRAPTFLALTGYEQVRSVVASLAGDHAAAARSELRLPATGVCNGSATSDSADAALGGCCSPAPQLVAIGRVTHPD